MNRNKTKFAIWFIDWVMYGWGALIFPALLAVGMVAGVAALLKILTTK